MTNDIFSDLLKSSGSVSNSSKIDEKNLSLNQRLQSNNNSNEKHNALDLDFLDNYVSNLSSAPTTSVSDTKPNNSIDNSNIDDLLFSTSNNKQNNILNNQQTNQLNSNLNNTNLLDDFFGQPIPKKDTTSVNNNNMSSNNNINNTTTVHDTISSIAKTQVSKNSSTSLSKERKNNSIIELKDAALAELLDMGFPLKNANIALESTSSGYDVNAAISYLMEQAHNSSKQASRNNINNTEVYEYDDLNKIVNNLSTDIMSTASFLFNSGKKKIQQGVEMYRQQKFENNDGKPIWMKNQLKYKANSMKLSNNGNEEEEEMDQETMKILIQQQRLRDQNLKREKERNFDLLSSNNNNSNNNQSSRSHSRISSVDSNSRINLPQKVSTNISSKPSKPIDQIYKSSARHRSNKNFELSITTPIKQSQNIPSLIETSTSDLLTSASSSSTSSPSTSSSSFKIPPLDSAQKLAFTTSREIAQEKFKTGDYSSSLENYLSASNVIPIDHPFQIILNSNIALVYSKLGNPKDQLISSNKGLDLISKLTNNLPINKLSTIKIEDNKTLKFFWIKLMTRRAESLEFTEKWLDAKNSFEKLISEGESTKLIMDGKNRCLKALNPSKSVSKPVKKLVKKPISKPILKPKNNEVLKNVQESNKRKEMEDEEKFNLHDKVESKLNNWRMGNKDNIRALICSLDNILWPELNWKPVKLTDLVLDNKVKIYYMKAVAKTHPDKINNNESTENKMIANGVFITLNEAWETFKKSKGM